MPVDYGWLYFFKWGHGKKYKYFRMMGPRAAETMGPAWRIIYDDVLCDVSHLHITHVSRCPIDSE